MAPTVHLNHDRIAAALAGEIETTALTAEEKAVWSERFLEKMSTPGPNEEAFFAELRQSGEAGELGDSGDISRTPDQSEK